MKSYDLTLPNVYYHYLILIYNGVKSFCNDGHAAHCVAFPFNSIVLFTTAGHTIYAGHVRTNQADLDSTVQDLPKGSSGPNVIRTFP